MTEGTKMHVGDEHDLTSMFKKLPRTNNLRIHESDQVVMLQIITGEYVVARSLKFLESDPSVVEIITPRQLYMSPTSAGMSVSLVEFGFPMIDTLQNSALLLASHILIQTTPTESVANAYFSMVTGIKIAKGSNLIT